MSQQKSTFKENYNNGELILKGTYSEVLEKKDLKNLKKDLYKILIEIHHTKLRKFENSWRRFDSLLKRSERLYYKLPTSIKAEGINPLLESDKKIKKFIDTYQREERSEDPVGIQKAVKKKRDRIKNEIQKKRKEQVKQIESLKKKFISEQWIKYEIFFNEDLSFRNEVKKAIKRHFKINKNRDFEIYDYLIKIIKARKSIIGILRSSIEIKRTNLLEGVQRPEMLLPERRHFSFVRFFSYILLNSDLLIESEDNSYTIKLDINKFYKNFFRLFSKSNENFDINQTELEYDKDLFVSDFLGIDTIHKLKLMFDKKETGILSFKEVQTKDIVDIELDPKYIKKAGIRAEEQKTPIFMRHESRVLIKLDVGKIILNLFKDLYSLDQEVLKDTQLRKIKKRKKSHGIVKKYHIKVVVPVIVIITGFVIFAFFYFSPSGVRIQQYDSVKIDYKVWESDEDENYNVLNPILDTTLWITMIPITENYSTGLILGLYNSLLGKGMFFESGLLWLNKCIDQDRNGIDDVTGDIALTYGNSSDLYFNIPLMVELKVLGIQKSNPSSPNTYILDKILPIVVGIFVAILIGILIFESIGLILNYRRARKKKIEIYPELKYSVKQNVLKYGLLILIILTIPMIVLFSVSIRVPLSDFNLLIEYYPIMPVIIIALIIVIWIVFIPLYLFLFKMIKLRRKKRK